MAETEKATSPLTCSLPIVLLNIEKSVTDKLKSLYTTQIASVVDSGRVGH